MAKKKVSVKVARPKNVKIGTLQISLSDRYQVISKIVGPPPPPPGWRLLVVRVRNRDAAKVTKLLRDFGARN